MPVNKTRVRAKTIFPTVLLTLLSIVQALALELMWAHVTEHTYLYDGSFAAVLGWLQIAANLLGVFLVWLIYSDLVLRLSWVPTTTDALFPFLIGIMEFVLISTLGASTIGIWFVILSVLFAAMTWVTQNTMRRARADEDNHAFFDGISPATLRDHLFSALPVVLLALVGLTLWWSDNQGWPAMVALVAVNLLLVYQIWMNHYYTQRSYA